MGAMPALPQTGLTGEMKVPTFDRAADIPMENTGDISNTAPKIETTQIPLLETRLGLSGGRGSMIFLVGRIDWSSW